MKKICLLLAVSLLLSGCDTSRHLENKAHAISLGLDLAGEEIQISVQVPTIGGESLAGDKGAGAATYAIYSAAADDFPAAYDLLIATLPERLNLTQLKSIVISEDLARSDVFPALIESLFHIHALSAAATVIISRTSAREMLTHQKAFIGTHLSVSMPAMLENYASYGYIPLTSLSALYAGLHSGYSTPWAALGSVSRAGSADAQQNALAGSLNRQGENKNEYMGAALFDRNKMVAVLDGYETQLTQLLQGRGITINAISGFSGLTLRLSGAPRIRVDCISSPVKVSAELCLTAEPLTGFPDMEEAARRLTGDLRKLVSKCQSLEVEPFRFAEYAAASFLTAPEWEAFGWLRRFASAEVEISVALKGID